MEVRLPNKLHWNSGIDDYWTESEGTSSSEEYEHKVESLALEVIRQKWSGEMVSVFVED